MRVKFPITVSVFGAVRKMGETTRDIAVLAIVVVLAAALGGYLGYEISQPPSPPLVIIKLPPQASQK